MTFCVMSHAKMSQKLVVCAMSESYHYKERDY